jgi:hypothetical protein
MDVDQMMRLTNKIDGRATEIAEDILVKIAMAVKGDPAFIAIILRAVIVKLNAAHEAAEKMANG